MLKIQKQHQYRCFPYFKGRIILLIIQIIPQQIITCPASPGVNEHPVVVCNYWDNKDNVWRTKNVHISIDKFNDWMALRRDQMISELV